MGICESVWNYVELQWKGGIVFKIQWEYVELCGIIWNKIPPCAETFSLWETIGLPAYYMSE